MKQKSTKPALISLFLTIAAASCMAEAVPLLSSADMFSDRDLRQTVDSASWTEKVIQDNSDIQINRAGIYHISGNAVNSTIIIDTADDEKVQLVLENLSIRNRNKPGVYLKEADKVFITTIGTNSLAVSGDYVPDGETNLDAVIFSRSDLVLNGTGTLTVISAEGNGITSKDDLKITGGSLDVTAEKDGLEANDSIRIYDGNISVASQKDALHSEHDNNPQKGYIYIQGGNLEITAADDAIQGNSAVQIDGGTIQIASSQEGIESTRVQINGGTIDIYATDDGINAAEKSDNPLFIEVNGGNISIEMAAGDTDAFDSNGDLYINGGIITIQARSPFDADGKAELNGGTVKVNGALVTEITTQHFGGRRPRW